MLPIVSFDRFSRLAALINTMKYVLMFCSKIGCLQEEAMVKAWGMTDLQISAKVYLLKVMQKQCFINEVNFLANP